MKTKNQKYLVDKNALHQSNSKLFEVAQEYISAPHSHNEQRLRMQMRIYRDDFTSFHAKTLKDKSK